MQELRIDYGPGYRVYLAQEGSNIVLLLCEAIKALRHGISRRPSGTGASTGVDHEKNKPYQPNLIESLKEAQEAEEYLNAAHEEDNPELFLLALRNVAEAQGGVASLADKTKLNRESLYRMLSERGNPELKSLDMLLHAMGFRLAVAATR